MTVGEYYDHGSLVASKLLSKEKTRNNKNWSQDKKFNSTNSTKKEILIF